MSDANTVFSVNNANATNETMLDMASDYFIVLQNSEYDYFNMDNAISLGWIFIVAVLGIFFIIVVLTSAGYALWGAGRD